MDDTKLIDVVGLGRSLGVPEGTFSPPGNPDGRPPMVMQYWTKEHLHGAFDALVELKAQGGRVALVGHIEAWVMLAIARYLMPECRVFYVSPPRPGDAGPVELDLCVPLPLGELNPELNFKYSMHEEGDRLYIDYDVDCSGDDNVHTMDPARIPELVLPPIPADRHVFLYGSGPFSAQVAVANAYVPFSKSVSTAYREDAVYYCAVSGCEGIEPGDTVPRVK